MRQKVVTRSDTREKILEAILNRPGIHLRALVRAIHPERADSNNLSCGDVEYHIHRMKREGLVVMDRDYGFKHPHSMWPFYNAANHDQMHRIMTALLTGPKMRSELAKNINRSDSTLTFMLNKLIKMGIIVREKRPGNRAIFNLVDLERTTTAVTHVKRAPSGQEGTQVPSSLLPDLPRKSEPSL